MSSQIFLAANQSLDILLSIFCNFFLEVSTGYFILKLMIKNHGLSCLPSMVLISIESLNVLKRCLILFYLTFKDKQSYGNFNTLPLLIFRLILLYVYTSSEMVIIHIKALFCGLPSKLALMMKNLKRRPQS